MVLEVVAEHFDVPAGSLIGYRCRSGSRPLAVCVAIAAAKTVTGATFAQKALDAGTGSAWDSVSRIRHLRAIDPDLARRILAIEVELGALPEAG